MMPLLEAHDALLSPTAPGPAPAGLGWTGDASLCAPWSIGRRAVDLAAERRRRRSGCRWRSSSCRRPAGVARLLGVAGLVRAGRSRSTRGPGPEPTAMLDLKIEGAHGHRRHRAAGQPHRRRHPRRDASSPSATSRRETRGPHAQRLGQVRGARLHRHALALRLAPVGQPARRVEDPPGRDHRGRRQLRLLAGAGLDGVPRGPARLRAATSRPGMDFSWRSVGDYLRAFDASGTALNVVQLVGHGTLRVAAMGFARRAPDGRRADDDAAAAGRRDGRRRLGPVDRPHLRAGLVRDDATRSSPSRRRRRAIAASTPATSAARAPRCSTPCARRSQIGREADMPVQISHVKAAGRPNWGKVADALALIDAGARRGPRRHGRRLSVHGVEHLACARCCPTGRSRAGCDAMLKRLRGPRRCARASARRSRRRRPARACSSASGWENIMIACCPKRKDAEGKRIAEIAAAPRLDPVDAVVRAARRRRRRGLHDPVPARRGRPAPRARASGTS